MLDVYTICDRKGNRSPQLPRWCYAYTIHVITRIWGIENIVGPRKSLESQTTIPRRTTRVKRPKPGQLRAHETPVSKLKPPFLYVSDPVVQRPPDRTQSAVVLREVDVRMALKSDGTDSRYNDSGSDTESFEQTVL